MLKNYLTIALRHLRRHKGYAAINVAGLGLGLACCLLLFLFVRDERSYDRFHERADRVYRVLNERRGEENVSQRAVTPPALAPTLLETLPNVEAAVRFFEMGDPVVAVDDRRFVEEDAYFADASVFDVFTLPLLRGDPASALSEPNTVVLTETTARRYFGDEDPLGRTIRVQNQYDLRVTGVMEDLPAQTHLPVGFLASFATLETLVPEERAASWIWQQFYTYVLLPEGTAPEAVETRFPALVEQHATPATSRFAFTYGFRLQPLPDVHLHSAGLQFDASERGNAAYVYAFALIALFVLLIACFNFMNLSTARSLRRAKEVGLRKVIGANRMQLVRQFLGESVLLALLAMLVAALVVELALPALNAFSGKTLSVGWLRDPAVVLGLLGGCVLVGLLAGSYPAFFLSRFEPARVLKGTAVGGARLTRLRQSLVVVQFSISIALLIGTAVVLDQLAYLRTTDLGFDEEQVVVLPLEGDRMEDDVETFKAEILRHPGVVAATASWGVPGGIVAGDDVRLPGSDTNWPTNMFTVDHDYLRTFGMRLVAGRDFDPARPADAAGAFLLNETAARQLGWTPEEALGRRLEWDMWGEDSVKTGEVIGVVEDFHFYSLRETITPMVIHIYPPAFGNLSVRIRPENAEATLAHLKSTWEAWAPEWPYEYTFLDEDLDAAYKSEERLGTLFGVFTGLAIFIACLGLFGLAAFTAERRTKELGIRKVLGASVPALVMLLSKDFTRLVLVAFVAAAPVAYLAMDRWLAAFPYRVDPAPGLFVLAGAAALAVAWLTVSYQSLKAARQDPAKTLRYE